MLKQAKISPTSKAQMQAIFIGVVFELKANLIKMIL